MVIRQERSFDRCQDDDGCLEAGEFESVQEFAVREDECSFQRKNDGIGRESREPAQIAAVTGVYARRGAKFSIDERNAAG